MIRTTQDLSILGDIKIFYYKYDVRGTGISVSQLVFFTLVELFIKITLFSRLNENFLQLIWHTVKRIQ